MLSDFRLFRQLMMFCYDHDEQGYEYEERGRSNSVSAKLTAVYII